MAIYTIKELKTPAVIRRLLHEQQRFKQDLAEALGNNANNWVTGQSVPADDDLSRLRNFFNLPEPLRGEDDELASAVKYDHTLRQYQDGTRYDSSGITQFKQAFTEATNQWLAAHEGKLDTLLQAMEISRDEYVDYRAGTNFPRAFPQLKKIIKGLALSPENIRPIIQSVFTARRFGIYETPEEVLADIDNITEKGKLFSRFRLATMTEIADLRHITGINDQYLHHYDHGILYYAAHADSIANIFFPPPNHEDTRNRFLQAVRRTHGIKLMEEIFDGLENYTSSKVLVHDLLKARSMEVHEIEVEGLYKWSNRQIPDPTPDEATLLAAKLGLNSHTDLFLARIAKLRDQHALELQRLAEVHAEQLRQQEEARLSGIRETNMANVFAKLGTYEHFRQLASAVREAKGLSMKEVSAAGFGNENHQNVDRLENPKVPDYTPTDTIRDKWCRGVGLNDEQTQQVHHFIEQKRHQRKARNREHQRVSSKQRGDFAQLLRNYMTANDIDERLLSTNAKIWPVTLEKILNGQVTARDFTINNIIDGLNKIAGQPLFQEVGDFFEAAAALKDQVTQPPVQRRMAM